MNGSNAFAPISSRFLYQSSVFRSASTDRNEVFSVPQQ